MLEAARSRGLDVRQADVLDALRDEPDGKLALVSGFHIAEHLPFAVLLEMITEARRVLRPGGVLILETPNPENLVVGTANFYLDPTHIAPIPPLRMDFMAEFAGFGRKTILRLNGPEPGDNALLSVFTDVSVDYSLVAQVDGPNMAAFDTLFTTTVGNDLSTVLSHFDQGLKQRLEAHTHQLEAVSHQSNEVSRHLGTTRIEAQGIRATLEERLDAAQAEAIEVRATLEGRLEAAQAKAVEIGATLERRLEAAQTKAVETGATLERRLDAAEAELASLREVADRTLLERLVLRPSGKPIRPLRWLAFHSNGRPRAGLLGRIALRHNGLPRPLFNRWMSSEAYSRLSWPSSRRAATFGKEKASALPPPSTPE